VKAAAAAATAGAAVVAAAAAVLVPTLLGHGGPHGGTPAASLSIQATVTPQEHMFGDHVRARVEVAVDPRRVDPHSVAIEASFAPYRALAAPRVVRRGDTVRLDAELVCLARACVPGGPQRTTTLPPATIRYRADGRARSASVSWPPLLVASRLPAVGPPALRERSDLPRVTATVDPRLLGWALAGAAGLLLLLAGAAVARRLAERPQAAEGLLPEEVPALRLALANVERLAADDAAARRAALDRLAVTLTAAGLARLAPEARVLAWSEADPTGEPMRRLADTIERALAGEAA
jgi:hypothetical protein